MKLKRCCQIKGNGIFIRAYTEDHETHTTYVTEYKCKICGQVFEHRKNYPSLFDL